jgi:hypothetical protein
MGVRSLARLRRNLFRTSPEQIGQFPRSFPAPAGISLWSLFVI